MLSETKQQKKKTQSPICRIQRYKARGETKTKVDKLIFTIYKVIVIRVGGEVRTE